MRRYWLVLLVVVALTASIASAGPPSFDQRAVEGLQTTGEPGLAMDPTNAARIYVVAPEGTTQLWRSDDTGATFQRMAPTPGGGGDSDVVVDADGVVYASDLLDSGAGFSMPVSTSLDHGATWVRTRPIVPGGVGWDRQWLAAEGHGHVVATGRNGGLYQAWVSRDAANTFTGPSTIASDAVKGGQPTFASDGTLYAPYTTSTEVRVGRSVDGGGTWTTFKVADEPNSPLIFPVLDVDDAGNLYVVWASGARLAVAALEGRVYLASSTDRGASWSSSRLVSDQARTAIFPWVAAGAPGKVAVSFYAARYATVPDLGPELGGPYTSWDVEVAQSLDALSASPTWSRTVAVSGFHTGSICTNGTGCPGPQTVGLVNLPTPFDRRHLDFFEMEADATGRLFIAFGKDRPFPGQYVGDLILPWIDLKVATQTGGDLIR